MFFGGYGFNGPSSPTSPTKTGIWGNGGSSPFRNTHMPLQEITMNQTYFPTGGISRSPGKASSGLSAINGGRTMKDYEDQLGTLQKENFNLKLRVYFLEETMGISSADENSVKNNIELKVEVESLRKELVEKQELLSQAAKAFQLHEEQKEAAARDQAQYQQSLERQQQRIEELEHDLQDLKEKTINPSLYYEEAFGITPETAIENKEKLQQMQEFVESLEAEVRQLTSSLNEERIWGQEVETERDELKKRLDNEIRTREKITIIRDDDNESLRLKIKELEEIALKRETASHQYKNELTEKDRLIKEKISLLEEKCKVCEELDTIAEKRQKQVEYLRASIKSRDDTITELNNKNRSLHNKIESSLMRRLSPPGSPTALGNSSPSSRSSQRSAFIDNSTNSLPTPFNWESTQEKAGRLSFQTPSDADDKIVKELTKELEERDHEIKKQEDLRKQLMIKLCNVEESSATNEKELKKVKLDYDKALATIQDLLERQSTSEEKQKRKDRKIVELQQEVTKLRCLEMIRSKSGQFLTTGRTTSHEIMGENNQRQFEDMEIMINELRNEIDNINAEKNKLEKQIHVESEELRHEIHEKQQRIECLEKERDDIKQDLIEKDSEISRLRIDFNFLDNELPQSIVAEEKDRLEQELLVMSKEVEEKDKKIDQLSKELNKKTQNLQQLVNTELWSKNKEIAKLHNHMTANQTQSINSQLDTLLNELNVIGVNVKFSDENVVLNYVNQKKELINIKSMDEIIQQLIIQKSELEKEVEYLKWLKLISNSDNENKCNDFNTENNEEYCELLRTHMKDLMKFMKEMLKTSNYSSTNEYKKIILDLLVGSQILSEDFVNALGEITSKQLTMEDLCTCKDQQNAEKPYSVGGDDLPGSVHSDSEAFSEPDRKVSLARIGLQDVQQKALHRSRFTKYIKTFSDSEDSIDYIPYHKTFQNDTIDIDASHQIQELKETNNLLYSELSQLRNELSIKKTDESIINEKLLPIILKLEKSQDFCQKLQSSFDKKINDNTLFIKNENKYKQRQQILEKKYLDGDNIAYDITKQKTELSMYKNSADKKTNELIVSLNNENDLFKKRINKIENENKTSKETISTLTRELDRLTLSHSQVLVENTKLTNDKLRLEQQIRKTESKYELTVRKMQEKFSKELTDLNQTIDSHRVRIFELENTNKELRRQVVVCETSDSAPSSSGISSVPTEINKQSNDVFQEYINYRGSQYWMPMNYQLSNGRSKSSCSPDLGIESDAAVSTTRPLKDTLKITESMTNLLSDDDNCNNNINLQDLDRESPLHLEGLDEMDALKKENLALKKRLMKTRRALEDTFEHLSASNKNKKNVEKAITKQLMMTKSILKKTRTYEEPLEN